jgi:hypothetical protein
VRVAEVEADAHIVQMPELEDEQKVLGGGGLAEQILHQKAHAEGAGEGAQVLERGLGVLDCARRPAVVALAQMHDEMTERNVLGGFEGALDLVHGVDAAGFFRMQNVDGRGAGAAHLAIGEQGRMHGEGRERF